MKPKKKEEKQPCEHCEGNKNLGYKFCVCGRQVNDEYKAKDGLYCPKCNTAAMAKHIPVAEGSHCLRCGKPTKIFIHPAGFMSCCG